MANLAESSTFDSGVYQLELTDPVIGGPSGISNTPLKNLANRTRYLKDQIDTLASGKAPLASPAFTGNPLAPTPAQFDNDTSMATTEFVQRALGSLRGVNGTFSASATLTAAHIGMLLHVSASPTLTLPAANSVPAGAAIGQIQHSGMPPRPELAFNMPCSKALAIISASSDPWPALVMPSATSSTCTGVSAVAVPGLNHTGAVNSCRVPSLATKKARRARAKARGGQPFRDRDRARRIRGLIGIVLKFIP